MNGARNIPLKLISWLSAVVILVAISSAIVVLFFVPSPSLAQYRITVALICFGLSSIAGLLFVAKVNISGKIGVFGITIGGTAALWLASLLIFNFIFPESSIIDKPKMLVSGKVTKLGRSSHELIMVGIIPDSNKTFTNNDGTFKMQIVHGENSYIGLAYFRDGEERSRSEERRVGKECRL